MATTFVNRWNITKENKETGKLKLLHVSSNFRQNAFDVMAVLQRRFPDEHYIMVDAKTNLQYDVTIIN